MRQHNNRAAFFLLPLALLPLAGCGGATGSGASSSLTSSTGRAALDVYVTDAFSDQYKQVLATLYKIELTTDGTNYITVFSSDTGQTLDLASLATTAALLGSVTVPTGTYTQARITFGDHLTLVSNSGTSTSVAVASSIGTQANGQVALVVATPTRVQANQTNTVFVDFKLAEFQLTGNVLTPSISCGAGTVGQMGRQRMGHLMGTVANLNGTTSFTLQESNGRTVTVALTSTTTITSGQTGSTITLANGQSVIVEGSYDPTTSTVTATSVTLNDYTTINHARAEGTVASVDATTSSFVLTVQRANGISPTGGTITVVTNTNTQFGKGRYQQGAFTDVVVGGTVDVDGVFDTTKQTLTANFVGLH
jgi:hypothetical protein